MLIRLAWLGYCLNRAGGRLSTYRFTESKTTKVLRPALNSFQLVGGDELIDAAPTFPDHVGDTVDGNEDWLKIIHSVILSS